MIEITTTGGGGLICTKCGRTTNSVTYTADDNLCPECCPMPAITCVCTGCIEKDREVSRLKCRVEFLEALVKLIEVTAKEPTLPDWLKLENIEGTTHMGRPVSPTAEMAARPFDDDELTETDAED